MRSEEELEKALRVAEKLEPLLSHIGLDGMAKALEALGELKEREARVEEPYVLARDEGLWLMRRGAILGDLELDKEVLLGREVSLSFPGDVEIAFRSVWNLNRVRLDDVRLRRGPRDSRSPSRTSLIWFRASLKVSLARAEVLLLRPAVFAAPGGAVKREGAAKTAPKSLPQ